MKSRCCLFLLASLTLLSEFALQRGALFISPRVLASQAESRNPVIVFVADGMRQDLMKQLVVEGKMPNYRRLLDTGVDGGQGLLPMVPAVSVVNWATIATGTSPGVHGATNNAFHDNRKEFKFLGLNGFRPWNHEGESIAEVAERNGLTAVVVAWKTFKLTSLERGAVLGVFPIGLTGRGVIANYRIPITQTWPFWSLPGGTPLIYRRVVLEPAVEWSNVPTSFSPAKETSFAAHPQLPYNVYIYDSTDDEVVNYDRVLVSPTKSGEDTVAVLGAGDWSGSIPATVGNLLGKFYIKAVDIEPDLSKFRLYFTSLARARAWPLSLGQELTARFDGMVMWHDYTPLWTGLIDERTYVEQVLHWYHVVGDQMLPFIVQEYEPDLVMAGTPVPDIIQHTFFSRAMSDTNRDKAAREFVELSYMGADRIVGNLLSLMPSANIIATSDHGFSSVSQTVCSRCILRDAGLLDPKNLRGSRAVSYAIGNGACVQIYVNLIGRNPSGVVPIEEYEGVRQRIVEAFQQLGPEVVDRILLKEETNAISTTLGVKVNMLHPDRTGDVVVFAAPPYTFNPPYGDTVFGSTDAGDHGYIPDGRAEGFAAFVAGGPGIIPGQPVGAITALDVASSVAFALGIDATAPFEGRVLPMFLPLPEKR